MASDEPPSLGPSALDVHVAVEAGPLPLARRIVNDIASGVLELENVNHALISIAFVGRRAIAALNRRHLGHAGPTDVISFAFARSGPSDPVIGDIYICPEIARENARLHKRTYRNELARLVIHGVLHVLGYDHPTDDARERSAMWTRQEELLGELAGAPR